MLSDFYVLLPGFISPELPGHSMQGNLLLSPRGKNKIETSAVAAIKSPASN